MRLGNWGYGQYGSTNYYPRWIAVKGYESTGAIMVDGWMVWKSESPKLERTNQKYWKPLDQAIKIGESKLGPVIAGW